MRTRPDLVPRRIRRPGMFAGGDGSTLSLDFTSMSGLDSRFTFSRASTATFINSSGLVASAANGVARFDHDPTTLAPRGLLIEGSATNLVLNSSSFTGGWFFTGTGTKSMTNNYATAPDGTTTAARLQLGQNCALKQIAGTTGVDHTVSIWVKSNTGSNQPIAFWTGLAAANRTATTSWTRIEAVVNNAAPTLFDLYNPNATDCDVLIWGAQLEAGSGASSYIPTGSGTVQRAADECTMTGANFSSWFNATGGTFLAHARRIRTTDVGRIASANDNTANESIDLGASTTGQFIVTDGGSALATITPGTVTANTAFKIAGAFELNNVQAALNGTLGTADTSVTMPTVTQLHIGRQGGGSPVYLNGTVSLLKFWPTRLPDATLQSLTT